MKATLMPTGPLPSQNVCVPTYWISGNFCLLGKYFRAQKFMTVVKVLARRFDCS
jgi:hypothetical protein